MRQEIAHKLGLRAADISLMQRAHRGTTIPRKQYVRKKLVYQEDLPIEQRRRTEYLAEVGREEAR